MGVSVWKRTRWAMLGLNRREKMLDFLLGTAISCTPSSLANWAKLSTKFLAEMLEMPLEDLSVQLWKNSCAVFNLPE